MLLCKFTAAILSVADVISEALKLYCIILYLRLNNNSSVKTSARFYTKQCTSFFCINNFKQIKIWLSHKGLFFITIIPVKIKLQSIYHKTLFRLHEWISRTHWYKVNIYSFTTKCSKYLHSDRNWYLLLLILKIKTFLISHCLFNGTYTKL